MAGRDGLTGSPSETTPALLELVAEQARRRRPAALLEQRRRDRYVEPSALDLRLAHRLDGLALAAAAEFEGLLLSPVAPLGACSVVAPTSQDRTLSTVRGTEVVSDPTNVLAIECATRHRAGERGPIRLCTIHQVVRAQPLPPGPGFSRHFRLFALGTSGPARGADAFEVEAFAAHLAVYQRLFDACAELGAHLPGRRIVVHAGADAATLGDRVAEALAAAAPTAELRRAGPAGAYYHGVRALYGAHSARTGDFVPLVDIGRFEWVARLTSNRKLRYVASGCGLQLIPALFGAGAQQV